MFVKSQTVREIMAFNTSVSTQAKPNKDILEGKVSTREAFMPRAKGVQLLQGRYILSPRSITLQRPPVNNQVLFLFMRPRVTRPLH